MASLTDSKPGRFVLFAVLALVVVATSLFAFAGEPLANTDDAFIVLVYARHLLAGAGLVWNADPVEGFTSPLDLLLKTAGTAVTTDPIKMAFSLTLMFHAGCALVVMLLGYQLYRRLPIGVVRAICWSACAGLAVATSQALAYGSSFLVETPLFIFVALTLSALMLRPTPSLSTVWGFGISTSLLAWARPEGVVLAAAALAIFAYEHRRAVSRTRAAIPMVIFAIATAGLFLSRLWYFGHWAPNTYYAKSSDSRWTEVQDGVSYVVAGSDSLVGVVLIVIAALGWSMLLGSSWKDERAKRVFRLTAVLAVTSVLMVIFSGGDSYDGSRFLALPFVLATVMLVVATVGMKGVPRAVAINALAALVLVQVAQTAGGSADKLRRLGRWPLSMSDYACDRSFAGWLSRAARDLPIAQTDFQQVKLLADELHVVDLRGLNDEQIAHLPWPKRNRWGKYDHDLGVSVNAPIWIWGRKLKTPEPISDYSMERLLADAQLMTYFTAWRDEPAMAGTAAGRGIHAAYLPASVQVCGDYRNFFVRKDVAARLAAAGANIGVSSGAPGSQAHSLE